MEGRSTFRYLWSSLVDFSMRGSARYMSGEGADVNAINPTLPPLAAPVSRMTKTTPFPTSTSHRTSCPAHHHHAETAIETAPAPQGGTVIVPVLPAEIAIGTRAAAPRDHGPKDDQRSCHSTKSRARATAIRRHRDQSARSGRRRRRKNAHSGVSAAKSRADLAVPASRA